MQKMVISIHAPHTGRDDRELLIAYLNTGISIHAPHTGRDDSQIEISILITNFNPRAPYGARRAPDEVRALN